MYGSRTFCFLELLLGVTRNFHILLSDKVKKQVMLHPEILIINTRQLPTVVLFSEKLVWNEMPANDALFTKQTDESKTELSADFLYVTAHRKLLSQCGGVILSCQWHCVVVLGSDR